MVGVGAASGNELEASRRRLSSVLVASVLVYKSGDRGEKREVPHRRHQPRSEREAVAEETRTLGLRRHLGEARARWARENYGLRRSGRHSRRTASVRSKICENEERREPRP